MSYRKRQIIGFGTVILLFILAFGITMALVAGTVHNTTDGLANATLIIGCMVLIILILSVLIAIWVIRGTTKSLRHVTNTITRVDLTKAEQLPRLHMDTGDELDNIADAFNNMADALERHNRQVRKLREHQEEQYFIQTSLAEAAHLYQGVENMAVLGEAFLKLVAPKVSSLQAGIYLRKQDNGEEVLTRVAAYAVEPSKLHIDSFRLGEGMVGQVALEKRRVVIGDLPAGYLIASGLGQAEPVSVLIQPVVFENQIEAVIEFAALQPFLPLHEKLLDLLCYTFGIAVNSVRSRTEVERLLQQSQQFTEELQTQAEELTIQQEQMQAINDQLAIQNRNIMQKSSELELTSQELERYAAELEQTTRYKTEFLANMSHELRTPLNSILILSQMMSENRGGKFDEEDADYAGIIGRAGEELLLLIDDILDLSKIEAGMIEVVTEAVVIAELPEMLRENFGKIVLSKGIELLIELADDVPGVVYSDGKRLNQILKNLVSNAIKFTSKGEVHVLISLADKEQEDCPDELKQADQVLSFRVRDTGIGIAREKQETIFQAFEQADETTSRQYGGTGLGLSICREFSRLLGGCIHVRSTPGEGSSFTLYLPSRSSGAEDTGEEIDSEGMLSSEVRSVSPGYKPEDYTILIVDDDDRNVFALQEYLEDQGFHVLIAWNGQDALEKLKRNRSVHLILMDLMMPIMDGYQAMREIRKDQRLRELPVIAMTAKAMKSDREECVAAGASDYISKPLHMKQLMSLIHVWTAS
ncbi:response regulator [Paenibacillus sp. 1P07SE]|uniref:response regulator n=1 Tax=Paenibacillus sp. 1P07SE TaxID=3132209 RepID=UPI0039A712FF